MDLRYKLFLPKQLAHKQTGYAIERGYVEDQDIVENIILKNFKERHGLYSGGWGQGSSGEYFWVL